MLICWQDCHCHSHRVLYQYVTVMAPASITFVKAYIIPLFKRHCGTKERGRFCSSRGWNSALERRSRVRGLVVGPFSHITFLLSCVVSSEFKQLVPAHKEHTYIIPPLSSLLLSLLISKSSVAKGPIPAFIIALCNMQKGSPQGVVLHNRGRQLPDRTNCQLTAPPSSSQLHQRINTGAGTQWEVLLIPFAEVGQLLVAPCYSVGLSNPNPLSSTKILLILANPYVDRV